MSATDSGREWAYADRRQRPRVFEAGPVVAGAGELHGRSPALPGGSPSESAIA